MAYQINLDRLKQNIIDLSSIGKREDGGIYRMGFSEEDFQGKAWLKNKINEYELRLEMDEALNISGILDGKDKAEQTIVVGSHIDTVPAAGALDGCLGVLTALECLKVMKDEKIPLSLPVEMIAFSDEEGRFGGMFGSRAFSGQLTPGIIEQSSDLEGIYLKDLLQDYGCEPMKSLEAARDPHSVKYYIELHIEQGPVLDNLQKPLGLVTDITGLFKWQVNLTGQANHAGTTPMNMRNDAFMGLADFAHEIPRILDENGREDSRMTVGSVALYPGAANTVPGKVRFSLDVRDTSEDVLNELSTASRKALSSIARKQNLMFDFEALSWISPVHCDNGLLEGLERHSKALQLAYHKMPSGAAHDAQIVARIAPVAMIFVPSKGGISHSVHEWTDWKDIEAGANLMLNALIDLAK